MVRRFSAKMKGLCEDIAIAGEERKRSIKDLRDEAGDIRDSARRFVRDCKKLHQEMAKDFKRNLLVHREELMKNVNSLRENFRKREREIRADLAEASRVWNKMNQTLKMRKRGEVK